MPGLITALRLIKGPRGEAAVADPRLNGLFGHRFIGQGA